MNTNIPTLTNPASTKSVFAAQEVTNTFQNQCNKEYEVCYTKYVKRQLTK